MTALPRVTLVTPTYAKDYQRFCLQRESIERCGIDLPHVAIIDHEDIKDFKSIPFQKNLTIVSSRDVLPGNIERRRIAWEYPRKHPKRWIGWKRIHGWMAQQLMKLAAPTVVETEGIVCLDSDTVFIDHIDGSDFCAPDGRIHLYESEEDLDAEMGEWFVHSLRFFGLPTRHQKMRRYVHSPVPWSRTVLLNMRAFIEERYSKPWLEAILDHEMIYEYMTYGVFARYVDGFKYHMPVPPSLCTYYWWPEQIDSLEQDFQTRITEQRSKAVLINSNIGKDVSIYRALVEKVWAGHDATGVLASADRFL